MDKILHIGLVGPLPPPYGGMANQLQQLSQLLQQEGLRVSVVQTNAPYGCQWIAALTGLRALARLLPYIGKLWTLAGKVDVLHVFANSGWSWQLFAAPALWLGWLRKTPVIINYRGGEAQRYFSQSSRWVRPSMNKAAAIIVPSGYLKAVFADFGFNAHVIPNIIDLARFGSQAHSRPLNTTAPHLIITRNLEAIYGIATAIKAVALLIPTYPNIRLSIAGSGAQLNELQQLVRQHQLESNVVFTGKLTPEAIAKLYQHADIMLNPTTVDNMPNSVLEALASGVAIITTAVGGIPYLVTDQHTALFTEVNQPEQMAQQIKRLLHDNALHQRLINNGLDDVKQYAWSEVKTQWLDLYQRLVCDRH